MRLRNAIFVIIAATIAPVAAHANLQQQMDTYFGTLTNVTNPQAYKGQRMGAFFGGSAYIRNRIVNASIMGFVPPHISAGCGGIDMFGGSFSFINAAQFKQLLRSIASNAAGYFFQIALQAMCPTCMEEISKLQKAVQKLNSLAGNSCMLGQAFANAAATAIIPGAVPQGETLSDLRKQVTEVATTATTAFKDTFDSLWPSGGKNQESKITATDPTFIKRNKFIGNIAWQLMNDQNIMGWMPFGDQNVKEAIMSMTGTFIVTMTNAPATGGGTDKSFKSEVKPPILTPEDLVHGTRDKVQMYQCLKTNAGCTQIESSTLTGFKDFTTRINDLLMGNGTNVGIIYKYAHPNLGLALTAQEKNFIGNIPAPIAAMIRNAAVKFGDSGTVRAFIQNLAPWIARDMAYRLVSEMVHAMQIAAGQPKFQQKEMAKAYLKMLNENVVKNLFAMRRTNRDADLGYLKILQTYNNLKSQDDATRMASALLKRTAAKTSN